VSGKKRLLFCIIGVICGVVGWIAYQFYSYPAHTVPWPYHFKNTSVVEEDLSKSHVLIIGDKMGQSLDAYTEAMGEHLSKKLKNPITFINLSVGLEGLHRTYERLKNLPKLPPIIIYLGGGNEFYEKKFNINDYKMIRKNMMTYTENSLKATLIHTFPILAKIFYHHYSPVTLEDEITFDRSAYSDRQIFRRNQLLFKLYELELKQMVLHILRRGSFPILMTAPINFEYPPNKTCRAAETPNLQKAIAKIENLFENEKLKDAFRQATALEDVAKGHAHFHFLKGNILNSMGQKALALKSLQLSKAIDCAPNGPHPVLNAIVKKVARKYGVVMVDFQEILEMDYGHNILFEDKVFPQHIYYQKALSILTKRVKERLKL